MNLYTIVDKIKEEWQHVKNENIQLYNIFIFYTMIEFNINKLPSNQLKELDVYINKCINNNININNIKKEIEQKEDDIQMDELSSSSSGLSDSDDDSESIELE